MGNCSQGWEKSNEKFNLILYCNIRIELGNDAFINLHIYVPIHFLILEENELLMG